MADPPTHSFPPPAGAEEHGDEADELMAAVAEGNGEAFAELIRRYGPRLYKYTTKITGSSEVGLQVANETWMGVFAHRGRYPGNFIAFILSIAKRKAKTVAGRSQPDVNAPEPQHAPLDIDAQIAAILPQLLNPDVQRVNDAEANEILTKRRTALELKRWRWFAAIFGVIALAAIVIFFARTALFGPRGAGNSNMSTVNVKVYTTPGARPIADAPKIDKRTEFSAAYTSSFARRAYVLVFVVDAGKEIHWIAPAFSDPTQDPTAMEIERTDSETPLRASVMFEGIAEGKLSVFAVVTERVTHVSDIERIPSTERTVERLRARFPDGAVHEWKSTVVRK
jgi:DNA-directed RNA polymerase specialized sigma24 family protein